MYEGLVIVGLSLWLGLPAWIANSTPVVFGGGAPIDGGRRFYDGHRILGDSKTIRGFVAGIVCGTLVGLVQVMAAPTVREWLTGYITMTKSVRDIIELGSSGGNIAMALCTSLLLSTGTLVGDMLGSFVKRRVGVESGGPSPVLDQIGFILMALVFASPILKPDPLYPAVLIVLTLIAHWLSNAGSYLLGLKEHPW